MEWTGDNVNKKMQIPLIGFPCPKSIIVDLVRCFAGSVSSCLWLAHIAMPLNCRYWLIKRSIYIELEEMSLTDNTDKVGLVSASPIIAVGSGT